MRLFRLPVLERDQRGLAVVSGLEQRISLVLVVIATVWFGLAASWEMFGPLLAGHYAASASLGIIAENMLRWDIAGPVWEYTAAKPAPSQYYCHHPWGIFWTTAAFMKVLGRHDYVCRVPAVLLSTATPVLLFHLGRAIWRPAAGAAAAVGFVVLPISLAFANFNALEVPVIAWSTLGLWATVRHQQTWKKRYLVLSLVGFGLALHADWPAYILVGSILGFALFRGILLRRAFGRVRLRPYVQWWALTAALCACTLLLYLYLFQQSGRLVDLLASYRHRSAGVAEPLSEVLERRRYWIELSFTPIAILVGKLAAVVCVVRLALRRSPHDFVPLAVLAMAIVHYVLFRQGADVHVYWPHYFALFFALGMGALTATAMDLVRRFTKPLMLPLAVVPLALLLLLFVLRDGVAALQYARATGGRFNEKGLLIHSDGAKTAFLRWLEPQLSPNVAVSMHEGMKTTWAQMWALNGRVVRARRPVPTPATRDAYVADTRFLLDHLQQRLVEEHHVVAVGPFWRVLPGEPAAPIDGYRIIEREPSLWEWLAISGTEPIRQIEADPFVTWELRTHFGQRAEAPYAEPRHFEQFRIAHNHAITVGDYARAKALRQVLSSRMSGPAVELDDGTQLVGTRYQPGARPTLTLLFSAAGPAEHDIQLAMRSRVTAPASWSTTMADPVVREVGLPAAIAPLRWREGFLYSYRVAIRKRPGHEEYELYFRVRRSGTRASERRARAPRARDGRAAIIVLSLD